MSEPSTGREIPRPESPAAILETVLYCPDLEAGQAFYSGVLGLELVAREPGAHVFFRCGPGMLLLFDPAHSRIEPDTSSAGPPIPRHGAFGEGHVAFRLENEHEVDSWRDWLESVRVPIEREIRWPEDGRSLYFRDPARNSVELATASLWNLPRLMVRPS